MHDIPILPQPDIPNYSKVQDESLRKESESSTGDELSEIAIDKVRRIIIRGQIDGE